MTVAVAGRLASYMSATGGSCYPGIKTLAAELLSKPQTVAKHIRLLEAGGYVEVHQGGGRGHRTEYYARLPIDVHDQVVPAPARARARLRAPAPRPPVDQVDAASDRDLQAPAAAAAVAEPAADQLAGGAQAHDDVAGADHGLVVGKVPGEASAAAAVTSADGAETVAHRQRGGEGVFSHPLPFPR